MRPNQLIINAARDLYLKYAGRHHRQIEREMHALGCLSFSRRVFYDQKTRDRIYPGWIKKFKWNELLEKAPAIREHSCSFVAKTCDSDFTAWLKQISPSFHWDWPYQQLIYEQLKRITTGESKRLMIFIPPRHGKSELVTVRYAVWRLLNDPSINIILGSYNQRLANRFSRRVRITWEDSLSEPPLLAGGLNSINKGQDVRNHSSFVANDFLPPAVVSPSSLSGSPLRLGVSAVQRTSRARLNTVAEWETGIGGGIRAVGVGGGITGFGADLVIIDDPVRSRAEAESKTYRERVYDWFNDDLYTRLEPNAAIILIQTRWHEDDLAGRLLKDMRDGGEHWDVISLPALAESDPRLEAGLPATPSSPPYEGGVDAASADGVVLSSDPLNRKPGEALCPARFNEDDLLRIQKKLGSYSFSALYQQRPTPPEGGLFKRAWFKRLVDRPPEGLRWVRGYDLAVSTRENADYTASFRCAIDKRTGDLWIADGFRKRIEFPEQRRYIVDRIQKEPNTEHGIEQALHGQAFIQDLRRDHRLFGRAFRGIKVTGDKFTRALSWANLAEEGKVVLVRGAWIDAFLEEVCSFPNSKHDDQLDAVSLAVEMLQRHSFRSHGF